MQLSSRTVEELGELLKERVDPDTLLELLDLSTERLVDRFMDIVEERRELVEGYLEEDE